MSMLFFQYNKSEQTLNLSVSNIMHNISFVQASQTGLDQLKAKVNDNIYNTYNSFK